MILITSEDISSIHFRLHIIENWIISVGDDGLRLGFEPGQVVDHQATEEGGAILKGGLVDDDQGALGLDALHHALDGRLAEVVAAGFHREAVDTDCRSSEFGVRNSLFSVYE